MSFTSTGEIDTYRIGLNKRCLCLSSAPGGVFFSTVVLLQSHNDDIIYEITIWVQIGGLKQIGSLIYECKKDSMKRSEVDYCSILWNPTADRLCVVINGDMLMLMLKWEDRTSNKQISSSQAAFISNEYDENFVAIDKLRVSLNISQTYSIGVTNATTCDSGSNILIGNANGSITRISWDGVIEAKYSISKEHTIFRIWTNSEFICQYTSNDEEVTGKKENDDIDTDESDFIDDKVFLCGWSQSLRLIAGFMDDGSIILLQSLQSGYHQTARIHPVMLLQIPKSKKLGKSSTVVDDLDSEIFNQKVSLKNDTYKEVISRIVMCRLVDSQEINEPESALIVYIVLTRHLPFMSENEDAVVTRSSMSLIITKINFMHDSDPSVVKKINFNHVACMRIKENIDVVGTSNFNYPHIDITSISNQPTLILTMDDSISCHPLHDIRSKIFHIGISYGLSDVIKSIPDKEEERKPTSNTWRYATTLVCMGKLIVSTVLCSQEEESSSSMSSLCSYDSQIHSTPLIEILNNPTLCQAESLLLDYSQDCLYVHSLASNPFRTFSNARTGIDTSHVGKFTTIFMPQRLQEEMLSYHLRCTSSNSLSLQVLYHLFYSYSITYFHLTQYNDSPRVVFSEHAVVSKILIIKT